MADRKFNFCAGPSALPTEVLLQAQAELLDWRGKGLSIMEMSHRSDDFVSVAVEAERDFRELMSVPDNYKVLFVQGGAATQFASVPLNLLKLGAEADYIDTGIWSKKAIAEAGRYLKVNVAASAKDNGYSRIPARSEWRLSESAGYVHYTPNETIGGVEFLDIPDVGDKPLVADMSSTILSRPVDISRFGVIYAGAQKNIGPAGLTLVIVREDLLGYASDSLPTMLNYKVASENDSMVNTPPTFSWYLAGLVFKWLKGKGGVQAMEAINCRKAGKLYSYIDDSEFYANPIDLSCRSWMNVPFTLKDDSLDQKFLQEAEEAGLLNLQGHRSVGGMRASLYNALPEEAVDALVGFMQDFAGRNA
ncbi:3-phosphoserine/phosphohydroxythreonine transaminase [Hahella sp. CR1]|uniref:3-phosphoserine/phosphohydroxythreonine transaminase n=1 Tax=Hahella sp. CR1 TaxID=2992807 RepID=UPI0024423FF3|nr:3-phosphoserine/phosphohydroxythreonine transaminase [Hahella sp. CR1]MDG9668506.1 3-phosphoserine/phosphohydroxythreonine transaminase [Hahella sp. CR1]